MERLLVALDRQDATGTIGDGDDAAKALDLAPDRRRGAAELGEHDLVLQRMVAGRLVERGRRRRRTETRVDVVLLAASIPGGGHLGPNPTDTVVPREEPFTRGCHRLVPLHVSDPVAFRGLAHARGEGPRCMASTRATSRAGRARTPARPSTPGGWPHAAAGSTSSKLRAQSRRRTPSSPCRS